jgi:hypothetical protein
MTLTTPIDFFVRVDGVSMVASVIETIDNSIFQEYRLKFSDGFQDDFTIPDEEGLLPEGTNEASKKYAKAIRIDMAIIPRIEPGRFYHVFQELIDGIQTNVWVIEQDPDPGEECYAVYYNEFYRFELYRSLGDKTWEVASRAAMAEKIDDTLAHKVGLVLNSLL